MDFGVPQSTSLRLGALGELLLTLPADPLRILEIGSYEGSSALHWSHTLGKAGRRGDVLCVDPWKPYIKEDGTNELHRRMNDDLRTGATFERFQENIKGAHPNATIRYVRGTSETVPSYPWFYDFIYIDGSHAFSDVMVDLERTAPQLKGGGILAGDDLESQVESQEHERHLWPMREEEWPYAVQLPSRVTLAVWKFFGRRVWCREGAWAMRKVESAFVNP